MKNKNFWIPTLMAVFMAIGLLLGNMLSPKGGGINLTSSDNKYSKIQHIIEVLDKRYVDTINGEELFEKTIDDMLHNLDPHTDYISAGDIAEMQEQIHGKFGGVGVRFFIIRDTLCITNVVKGSPSERAGILAGDKILTIDGENIASKKITNDDVQKKLKGLENTEVKVKVLREGKKLDKTIVRGAIPIQSVIASYLINPTTGFVKISNFSMTTDEEFKQAVSVLKAKGMKQLIVDLRSNGGGVMQSAIEIIDEFLLGGLKIVETKGKNYPNHIQYSTSNGALKNVKVAVLINSSSASASEILAGAIQDNDRGVIIGRRSFGKGLVQEDIQLKDGSNLRLVTARYYTPTGRCIQKEYNGDFKEYYQDNMERYENGELYQVDSTLFVDSLKFLTPKGKVVYGGGGIMPDVFVPLDTTGSSWYLTELRYAGAFAEFAFDFVSNKRKKWKNAKEFKETFVVDEVVLKQFTEFATSEFNIQFNEQGFRHSKSFIQELLKSEIARQLWIEDGFYQVFNEHDVEVQEALKQLSL